ncbi:uncharacterized protein TM35_002791000, partial [Trypanosoma theileri]
VMNTFTGDPILSTVASGNISKKDMNPHQSLKLTDEACKAVLERCQEAKEAAASLNRLLGTKVNEAPHSIMKLVKPIIDKLHELETCRASREQEVNHLRMVAEESLKLLSKTKPSSPNLDSSDREGRKKMLIIRRGAEEASQHGDDLPLRMLSECETISKAISKLRKSFLDNIQKQEEITNFETLVDAICQEMNKMNQNYSKKQQEVDTLRAAAEESLKSLENPQRFTTTTLLNPLYKEERKKTFAVLRAAEEADHHGDSLPLRLLSNCEASAKAFQKLRKLLQENVEQQQQEETMSLQAIADAICQQVKTLREELLKGNGELGKLRALEDEKGRLLNELRSHDERWELPSLSSLSSSSSLKRGGKSMKSHHTKQFDGTGWKDILQHKPAELQRSFIIDAVNACHVDPDSLTNIHMTAEESSLLVEFDVQHDPSITTEEIARRINEFPFRAVKRMYDRRSAPKDGMDLLQEQLTEKEKEVETLRLTMEVVIESLEKPNAKKTNLQGQHAAEEAAHRGDNKPLQLLNNCESIIRALEKLR